MVFFGVVFVLYFQEHSNTVRNIWNFKFIGVIILSIRHDKFFLTESRHFALLTRSFSTQKFASFIRRIELFLVAYFDTWEITK